MTTRRALLRLSVMFAAAAAVAPQASAGGKLLSGRGGGGGEPPPPPPPSTPPTATTNAASGVTASAATLNGSATAGSDTATLTFDYGTSASYGSSIAASPASMAGGGSGSISAALSGLQCNTTYHFRARAVSASGTGLGSDQTFVTSACAPPPPPAAGQRLAEPLIVWRNNATPLTAADQFTLTWEAPTWMADYYSPANTITGYTVYYGTDRTQVMLGPEGTGTTAVEKSAGQLSHTQTGLANGTWYAAVTANNSSGRSYTSNSVRFTVT